MGNCCSKKAKDNKTDVVESAHLPPFELKIKDDSAPDKKPGASPLPQQAAGAQVKQTTVLSQAKPQAVPPQPSSSSSSPNPAPANGQGGSLRQAIHAELGLSTLPVLDAEQALEQSSGEYDFLVELFDSYQKQYTKQLGDLKRGLRDKDWNVVALEAHSLKGAAANLFIMRMRAVCFGLEKLGKSLRAQAESGEEVQSQQMARVEALIQLLEETHAEFEVELQKLLSNAEDHSL